MSVGQRRNVGPMPPGGPSSDTLPEVYREIRVAEFGSELVLFDPLCMQVHLLGDLDAVVYDACSERVPTADLVMELRDVLGLGSEEAREAIEESTRRLEDLGLVGDGAPRSRPP